MHHNRVRKVDAKTHIITTVAGNGALGPRPATTARRRRRRWPVRPASRVVPEPGGSLTIFIADYYNGHVRAVGPDGIIRDVSDEGRVAFGAPTRVAFAAAARLALRRRLEPRSARGADRFRRPSRRTRCRRAGADPRPKGGRMSAAAAQAADRGLLRWTLSFLRPYRARVSAARGAARVRDRARRAAAVAAQDRHRLRARPEAVSRHIRSRLSCTPLDLADARGEQHRLRAARRASSSPAWCCRSSTSSCPRTARRCRSTPASGWSTTCAARLFEHLTGARPASPHHHEHGRRGLSRRRRRLRDREPGDERPLSAGDVDHRADRDVRHPAAA